MKALYKKGGHLQVCSRPSPRLSDPRSVKIQVAMAGLCRTDLYVAQGLLKSQDDLILGHEFSGVVVEVGSGVEAIAAGARVAVFPWLGCGSCSLCLSGRTTACHRRRMLGVDLDGAFAEEIVVPAKVVYVLPEAISFQAGAYVEPVAAALAVIGTGIERQQRGLIYGRNRIGDLTRRVLHSHGFDDVALIQQESLDFPDDSFDYAVETLATPAALREIVRLLKPGGLLILKSRYPQPIVLDLLTLVAKELTLKAVNYGSFRASIELLRSGRLVADELLGPIHPLEDWPLLFDEAASDESCKRFFRLDG